MRSALLIAAVMALAGCNRSSEPHEDPAKLDPINGPAKPAPPIAVLPASPAASASPAAPAEAPHWLAIGTEPFWSADVAAGSLRYATPENQAGTVLAVSEDKDGIGERYSGTLQGQPLTLLIQPGKCSDGMSDKAYAYSAKLLIGTATLRGCAERK